MPKIRKLAKKWRALNYTLSVGPRVLLTMCNGEVGNFKMLFYISNDSVSIN